MGATKSGLTNPFTDNYPKAALTVASGVFLPHKLHCFSCHNNLGALLIQATTLFTSMSVIIYKLYTQFGIFYTGPVSGRLTNGERVTPSMHVFVMIWFMIYVEKQRHW